MKQYTSNDQTAKLIELGFNKPKSYHDIEWDGTEAYDYQLDYSIGELIEMLPDNSSKRIRYVATKRAWIVDVDVLGNRGRCHKGVYYAELIDALYDVIVKLKEEGVI